VAAGQRARLWSVLPTIGRKYLLARLICGVPAVGGAARRCTFGARPPDTFGVVVADWRAPMCARANSDRPEAVIER